MQFKKILIFICVLYNKMLIISKILTRLQEGEFKGLNVCKEFYQHQAKVKIYSST